MDFGRQRFTGESFYSNDLYAYNVKKNTWSEIRPDTSLPSLSVERHSENGDETEAVKRKFSPCGRRSHTCAVYKNKVILFGGFQENIHKHFNDLYEFDTGQSTFFGILFSELMQNSVKVRAFSCKFFFAFLLSPFEKKHTCSIVELK